MTVGSQLLPGFEPTDIDLVRGMSLTERVDRAIALLRKHEPTEGYYLAFSGGKDSCAIKKLAQMAGVKFEAWYNQTTIDPPELVRFIKAHHADVKWNIPERNMLKMVSDDVAGPPTRQRRWCCRIYKEGGGEGKIKVMGVRAAESGKRAKNWREFALDWNEDTVICPVVYWSHEQLWEFIHAYEVPYCELYDEGLDRLGCVGCPLADRKTQDAQFERWPKFRDNWKRAVIANWEKWHNVPRNDGKPRFHARFKTGEEFWDYWRNTNRKKPDVFREDCQSGLLWTNQELNDLN